MASNPGFRTSMRPDRPPNSARNPSVRPRPSTAKRSVGLRASVEDDDPDSCRVRVAIRLRPKNAEELSSDSDLTDCVELIPELKRLKLRKNNWSAESYRFDAVFTESASQKRIYDDVAKPVVESVLNGYNGTVMAYGQTGTGKTYTVGHLGKDDPSERGIMIRALEDIIADTSPGLDTVAVSYLQLYLETIQDLLAPERTNIPIAEEPKTGEVSLPGASVVEIKDIEQFMELLQTGEANRHAANTKLNTESSRSHAILMVYIQRSSKGKEGNEVSFITNSTNGDLSSQRVPVILKSKLLIVDLAGSERIDKSGSEGHMLEEAKFINLSLTSLGKCINALAENSPHIPTRDSKLTRLLRDSFGGTARTSLVITIGPSARHYSETASTIMFGQRAMKVVNMVKLREEFDYESLCRKLENQVDYLTSEMERQQKLKDIEKEQMEKKLKEFVKVLAEVESTLAEKAEYFEKEKIRWESDMTSLLDELNIQKGENGVMHEQVLSLEKLLKQNKHQLENSTYQKVLADTTQMYEKKVMELIKQLEDERSRSASLEEQLAEMCQNLSDNKKSHQRQHKQTDELSLKLQDTLKLYEEASRDINSLKEEKKQILSGKDLLNEELKLTHEKLLDEKKQRKCLEDEVVKLRKLVSESSFDVKARTSNEKGSMIRSGLGDQMNFPMSNRSRETISTQRATISKIFEGVGLSNILALLKSEDSDVQIHAVKVVANLAAEDINQEKIVQEGGLDALLMLLESSENGTIHRLAAGAIANLAMNGLNQGLIMGKGGARLLANIASRTNDVQTLRMVAGALANLCGNEKLHLMLKEDGGTKALLEMLKSEHTEVISQVARGIANFAKCESRAIIQGHRKGKSLLIEDGVLYWMVSTSTAFPASTRRHMELALCHLAQNEDNASDIISSGAIKELVRISKESSREDIRNLAKKALNSIPDFSTVQRS